MKIVLASVLLCSCMLAQGIPRHTLTAGFLGEFRLARNSYYLRARPGVNAAYGLRVHRLFQIDVGMDWVPRPLGSSVCCRDVDNAADHLFLVPIGGRLVLGPRHGRWTFSLGGGAAYMNHKVGRELPGYSLDGISGSGGYALVHGSFALGRSGHYRLGGTSRLYLIDLGPFVRGRILTVGPELNFTF